MARILDETRDHSGPTPFFGESGDDSHPITIPQGEQFDRVELKILQQTRGGASISFAPDAGATGSSNVGVHWWYDGGPTRGRIKYQVQAFSKALPANRSTRYLDFRAAQLAGATFDHHIVHPTGPYWRLGVGDWLDGNWTTGWNNPLPGVVFQAVPPTPFAPGLKANPEAFNNFKLKNGWTVKSISRQTRQSGKTVFRVRRSPAIGSDTAFFRVQIGTEPPGGSLQVAFAILIEGPRGTDPYFD